MYKEWIIINNTERCDPTEYTYLLPWRYVQRGTWASFTIFATLLDPLRQLSTAQHKVVSGLLQRYPSTVVVVCFSFLPLASLYGTHWWSWQYLLLRIVRLAPDYTWLSRLLSHKEVYIFFARFSSPRFSAVFLAVIVQVSPP